MTGFIVLTLLTEVEEEDHYVYYTELKESRFLRKEINPDSLLVSDLKALL